MRLVAISAEPGNPGFSTNLSGNATWELTRISDGMANPDLIREGFTFSFTNLAYLAAALIQDRNVGSFLLRQTDLAQQLCVARVGADVV